MFAAHSVDLLALVLGERASEPLPAQALREALFARAVRLIALRFADPGLTPDRIAGSLGVSTRLLQKLFAERGATVMERIWEKRVSQAASLLAMPQASHRSITEIAFACGFNDSAHFTRAFAARVAVTMATAGSRRKRTIVWRLAGGVGRQDLDRRQRRENFARPAEALQATVLRCTPLQPARPRSIRGWRMLKHDVALSGRTRGKASVAA
jgi:AraC-like DNA-binding protein